MGKADASYDLLQSSEFHKCRNMQECSDTFLTTEREKRLMAIEHRLSDRLRFLPVPGHETLTSQIVILPKRLRLPSYP